MPDVIKILSLEKKRRKTKNCRGIASVKILVGGQRGEEERSWRYGQASDVNGWRSNTGVRCR